MARRRNVAPPHLARWVVRDRVVDAGGESDVEADLSGRWIDRVEIRLGKVAAFGLIDANGDGYVTLDEIIAPERSSHPIGSTGLPTM